jgi:surfactin synthase thioesterase subunit
LQALADIPAEIRDEPTLFNQAQRVLEADYTLYRSYRWAASNHLLECPILVFGGTDNPLVRPTDLNNWSTHTKGSCETNFFDGDHFYLRKHIAAITSRIANALTDC